MGKSIFLIIFVCGVIYGLINFINEIRKGNKEKDQLMLSIALIVTSAASLLILLD